jgi:hypothetical protein
VLGTPDRIRSSESSTTLDKRPIINLYTIYIVRSPNVGRCRRPKPEHLSKQQINPLIATTKTPAEHERIAQYYQAKALDYLAQAKEHEAMVAAYKANSSPPNDKNQASTISHCEYFVTTFKALADNSEEPATLHERMAKEAPKKLNPT